MTGMPEKRNPPSPGGNESALLLLVDDEAAFAEALAFRLTARGLPCLVAGRGEQALTMLDVQGLEVVLLDLNMPGPHGLDVLRHIKTARPELEVLLLTGEADLAAAATGMRRGAGDYLTKPVNFDALLASIAKARVRAREHRERLRAAEAGKLMALGSLAAGVGHEINNPLQIILQRSEWLQELVDDAKNGRPDYDEMSRSAEAIQAQARRAGEITAQLLGLAHKSREGTAESDAAVLAARVLEMQRERAVSLGAALRLDLPPDLPKLPCSPAELEPVLAHLVRNALDAIEARRIRPARAPGETAAASGGDYVRLFAENTGAAVSIGVEDTGEGIDPELSAYIFDPFFSLRPVGKGTGLGLTVCHSIVSALRGTLRFVPRKPSGAVFTMEIPLTGDAP